MKTSEMFLFLVHMVIHQTRTSTGILTFKEYQFTIMITVQARFSFCNLIVFTVHLPTIN